MKDLPKVYVDSCCFITLAEVKANSRKIPVNKTEEEVSAILEREENDAWHLKQAMRAARKEEMYLFTSFLTIAEATKIANHSRKIPSETKTFLDQTITSGRSGVRLASITRGIAEVARGLRWVHEINLKGPDAIHVATAKVMFVQEIWTGETGKGASLEGFQNREILLEQFGIRICAPSESKLIPEEFLQDEMDLQDPN